MGAVKPSPAESPWTPLRRPLFRDLWLASVFSNIGTWMQNVGGVWLMTMLTPSPFLAASMQAAQSLPFFIFALPSGALADMFDRRKLLILTQVWMAVAAALLWLLTLAGWTTPASLLGLTFFLGVGAALNAPAWQASIPEVAGREELPKAVALSGVGFNIARVVGPALGGLVLAAIGASANFALNALSFAGVIFVLVGWQRAPSRRQVPGEHLYGAMRAGIRFARHSSIFSAVLVRSGLFVFFASALWALLPVVARDELGLGSKGYGMLVGCLGTGSLLGAVILPRLSRTISLDARLSVAGLFFALSVLSLGFVHDVGVICFMMVVAGFAWLTTMVGVNVATQSVAPQWVQARAIALYVLVSQGGLAFGSFVWGAVSSQFGNAVALGISGTGLLCGLAGVFRWPLARIQELDTAPVEDWREPMTLRPFDPEDGPVLVTVEYRVDPTRIGDFCEALDELAVIRRRDGAIRWEIYHDVEIPGRLVENFVVESWAEHVRQHSRVMRGDLAIWKKVRAFHTGKESPAVSHLIYERG